MIWSDFPVGMSFSVKDFEEDTKKKCWKIALSALAATEVKNRQGMRLYDNCAENLPGSSEKEYVCILNHKSVTHSRVNVPLWREMSRLMAFLSLHYPFYQANALDGFGPYTVLGTILEDGTLSVEEAGKSVLPETLPSPMEQDHGQTVLIALPAVPDASGYASALKQAGKAAAEAGMKVRYCPLAEGAAGTTYALTLAARGRFEWLQLEKDGPAVLMGVIPESTVVVDLAGLAALRDEGCGTSEPVGKLISRIWDLGYRNMLFAVEGYTDTDQGRDMVNEMTDSSGNLDPRFVESCFTLLTKDAEEDAFTGAVSELIRLGAKVKPAMDLLTEKTNLPERIGASDILITTEHYEKKAVHPRHRTYTVSDREMREPELLYGIFLHKFTRMDVKK